MSDWIECTPLEAHQAFVAGACDAERKFVAGAWQPTDGSFSENCMWRYRIREKARMITVEILYPKSVSAHCNSIGLTFATQDQCDAAFKAITAAREGK